MSPEEALAQYREECKRINGVQNELAEFGMQERKRRQAYYTEKRRNLPKRSVPAGTHCAGCGLELAEGIKAAFTAPIVAKKGNYGWGKKFYCEVCQGIQR